MVATCNTFYLFQSRDQCRTIVSFHSITLANFYLWNLAVGSTSTGLVAGIISETRLKIEGLLI